MTMLSNQNNTNCNYDEQAKIMLDRFISQLNTPSEKNYPDDASAPETTTALRFTRYPALPAERALTLQGSGAARTVQPNISCLTAIWL